MPSFRSIALSSILAGGAMAAPFEKRSNRTHCMNDHQAQQVATIWGTLIADFDADLATAALTETFTDYSESVNTLINSCPQGNAAAMVPLLDPTFTTRNAFVDGQGSQPPINFEQLNIWHSCDTVIIRWKTTNTANITDVKPVIGLISMETVKAPRGSKYPYLIDTLYSEFDAGAWLQNLVEAGICPGGAGLSSSSSPPTGPVPTPTGGPVPTGIPSPSETGSFSTGLATQNSTSTLPTSYSATATVSISTTTLVTQTASAYA